MPPKWYNSPRWSYEVLDCSVPMALDTYNICSYNCLYCFSFFQRERGVSREAYLARNVRSINVDRVKRMFSPGYEGGFSWYIQNRHVMQWGSLSDQFDEYERQRGCTLDLMRHLREIKYPVTFSTKATWFTEDARYAGLICGADFWNFKVSIITLDQGRAAAIERGVPAPRERIEAIRRLVKMGVQGVTLRLRPFIPGVSDRDYLELIRAAADAGATAVSTEFLCLDTRASKTRMQRLNDSVGFNLVGAYQKQSTVKSGYLRWSYAMKRAYFDRMEALCKELGLRFHVSDAHHKARSATGSCCGLPDQGPCSNYYRGQFTHALVRAREKGFATFADLPGVESFSVIKAEECTKSFGISRGRFVDMSIYDHIRRCWNDVSGAHGPFKYFNGVLRPRELDADGNMIYDFDYEQYAGGKP